APEARRPGDASRRSPRPRVAVARAPAAVRPRPARAEARPDVRRARREALRDVPAWGAARREDAHAVRPHPAVRWAPRRPRPAAPWLVARSAGGGLGLLQLSERVEDRAHEDVPRVGRA